MRTYDVTVTITPQALYAEAKRLVRLEANRIPGTDKKGGDTGVIVVPLEQELQERAQGLEKNPFEEALLGLEGGPVPPFDMALLADHKTPWRVLMDVGLTAHHTSFKTILITQDDEENQHPIPISYPYHGLPPIDEEPMSVVWVQITPEGFQVEANGERIASGDPACAHTACKKDNNYDWPGLYSRLLELKQNPRWSEHVVVYVSATSPDTPLGDIVQTLDAVRFQRATRVDADRGEAFSDTAAFAAAPIVTRKLDGGAIPMELFPYAVLGSPPEPEELEEEEAPEPPQ